MLRTPDISNRRCKDAVFVVGCYWHGCPMCYAEPKSNTGLWIAEV